MYICICVWFHKLISTNVFQLFFLGYIYIYVCVCVIINKYIYIYIHDYDDDDDDDDPDCSEIWFSCGALPPAWVPCFFFQDLVAMRQTFNFMSFEPWSNCLVSGEWVVNDGIGWLFSTTDLDLRFVDVLFPVGNPLEMRTLSLFLYTYNYIHLISWLYIYIYIRIYREYVLDLGVPCTSKSKNRGTFFRVLADTWETYWEGWQTPIHWSHTVPSSNETWQWKITH